MRVRRGRGGEVERKGGAPTRFPAGTSSDSAQQLLEPDHLCGSLQKGTAKHPCGRDGGTEAPPPEQLDGVPISWERRLMNAG